MNDRGGKRMRTVMTRNERKRLAISPPSSRADSFFEKSLIVSGPVSLTKMNTSTIIGDFELGPVICAFVVFDRSWLL